MATLGALFPQQQDLVTVAPDETVATAITKTIDNDVSALPVMAGEHLIGIVTERDLVRRVLARSLPPHASRVEEIMTRQLITMRSTDTIEACMSQMIQNHIRHMLVVEERRLLAVTTIRDMIQQVLREKSLEVEQMRSYITGCH